MAVFAPKVSSLSFRFALIALAMIAWPKPREADAQTTPPFDHRWSGLVFDAFTFDGAEYWTVEDGGRIRHRPSATGSWEFQDVPVDVKDTLRRIHFVPDDSPTDGPTGWAVGETGWVIHTVDGGQTWNLLGSQMAAVLSLTGKPAEESLWDVHFLDETRGWLCGLHGIWETDDGGASWTRCTVKMQDGYTIFSPTGQDDEMLEEIEFYALDVMERQDPTSLIGMASAEPGLVFRTTDGSLWEVVLDIRCLCLQGSGNCTIPTECTSCYDCTSLPAIDGCLGQPGGLECQSGICNSELPAFEPWDIEMSRNETQKFAVVVGGIEHNCGMVFTSVDDGVHWKKEPHECDFGGAGGEPDCDNDQDYKDLPPPTPPISPTDPWWTHVYKNKEFGALYGVGIFDEDNSAIVGGYSGLHAYREPSTGIWRDVSEYNQRIDEVENAVTYPLFGATADDGSVTTGKGLIVGAGGFLREKESNGTGWDDAAGTVHGSPWRIEDLHFIDESIGSQIGQFSRIAKTTDSGVHWSHLQNPPQFDPDPMGPDGPSLRAITFANSSRGVTVGMIPSSGNRPVIYRTLNAGSSPWIPTNPTTGITMGSGGTAHGLTDVDFADYTSTGKADYWAAGAEGFMIHSRDDGETWTQFMPVIGGVPTQPANFTIMGVAFKDLNTGIFVGQGPDANSVLRASAFLYKKNGSPVWSQITPPIGTLATKLSDVVITGDTAFAVGERRVSGVRSGIVLRSSATNGVFGQFDVLPDSPIPAFQLCLTNDSLNDLVDTPVLTEAEIHPTTGDLWVGGQCGRVWKRTASEAWTEFKTQTDTHILGISFGAGSSIVGYFGGHRVEFPQSCVVRYQ